jgi:hypothetical protein
MLLQLGKHTEKESALIKDLIIKQESDSERLDE